MHDCSQKHIQIVIRKQRMAVGKLTWSGEIARAPRPLSHRPRCPHHPNVRGDDDPRRCPHGRHWVRQKNCFSSTNHFVPVHSPTPRSFAATSHSLLQSYLLSDNHTKSSVSTWVSIFLLFLGDCSENKMPQSSQMPFSTISKQLPRQARILSGVLTLTYCSRHISIGWKTGSTRESVRAHKRAHKVISGAVAEKVPSAHLDIVHTSFERQHSSL